MSRKFSHPPVPIEAVIEGKQRLSPRQALVLYQETPLYELGRFASAMCERIHGDRLRTYVKDRNINYTNVCSARCTFCAFRRDGQDQDAYVLSQSELHKKVRQLVEIGGTQILLQGGMHPDLPIEFYEQLLRELKLAFPQIHVHGFSPPEFVEFVAMFEIKGFPTPGVGRGLELSGNQWKAKLETIMDRLKSAGLDSLPGGGGEIFAEQVRRRIGLGKATGDQWVEVMACAHRLGMFTSATMMFGHVEGIADRINHLQRIRDWQDRAIEEQWPGQYISFISWPFQRENTPLGRVPDWDFQGDGEAFPGDQLAEMVMDGKIDCLDKAACEQSVPMAGKRVRLAGANDYLRTQAVSRLFLDNIPSIGSSWVTMGPKIGQLGLFFGANDMGSVMMEENVVSAAGTTFCLNEPTLCHLIREAGFVPAQRDNRYTILKIHEGPETPDRLVRDWSCHRAKRLHSDREPELSAPAPGDEGGKVPLTVSS